MITADRVIGRYQAVRWCSAFAGYGMPLILDRKSGLLIPNRVDSLEWQERWDHEATERAQRQARARELRSELPRRVRLYSQRDIPVAAWLGYGQQPVQMSVGVTSNADYVQSTQLCDNTYAVNTTAKSFAVRLTLFTGHGDLGAIYYYVTASAGSPTSILGELRPTNATITTARTTTTLLTSGTDDPTADGTMVAWHQIVPTTYSPVANNQWVIIGNTTGTPGTNNITGLVGYGDNASGGSFGVFQRGILSPYTAPNINNVTASMTAASQGAGILLKFADGTVLGFGFSGTVTPTSDTTVKGWRYPGFTERMPVWAMQWRTTTAGTTGAVVLYDTAGTLLAQGAGGVSGALATNTISGGVVYLDPGSAALTSAYVVPRATPFRAVLLFSVNSTGPTAHTTGNINGFTDVNEARPFGSGSYYAIGTSDSGSDDLTSIPHMALLIGDQVQIPRRLQGMF